MTVEDGPVEPAAIDEPLAWTERLSDRANPIVVREVIQATSGRLFQWTLVVAVSALVLVGLVVVARDLEGRQVFTWSLTILAPILLFVLPMQALASMRQEVVGGTADQLLMTRLSPRRIVAGKLVAASALFVMFLGLFAPLLGLTYLLRGIDIVTIVILIGFTFLACLVANSFAIAMGALGRIRWMRAVSSALAVSGLAGMAMAATGSVYPMVWEVQRNLSDDDFVAGCTGVALLGFFALGMFAAVAQAALTHEHENRSTPFRILGLLVVVAGLTWALLGFEARVYHDAIPGIVLAVTLFLTPLFVMLASEQEGLSPRVARYVPTPPSRAVLLAATLPGGGRGMLYGVLVLTFLAIGASIAGLSGRPSDTLSPALTGIGYALLFAASARRLRRSRIGRRYGFWGAVIGVLILFVLGVMVSLAFLAVGVLAWNPVHVVNVPWTLLHSGQSNDVPILVLLLAAGAVVLVLPDILRGVHEARSASIRREAIDAA